MSCACFESFLPFVYKKGFIFTLLFRYFNLCFSYATFHEELQRFRTLLNQNGYPSRFVEKCIREFLDKTFSPPVKQSAAPKYLVSFLLPFTGNHAFQIRQQLTKLMSSAYPHINLRIIFRPTFRLSNFLLFKDRIPMKLRSCIVYKFQCQRRDALYLGETCRQLHVRISDHMGISAYTGHKISDESF